MDIIKKNKAAIGIVLAVLALILIRSTGLNHFKNDAKRWAEPSFGKSNTITPEQAKLLKGKSLTINLDKPTGGVVELTGNSKNISADSILSRKIINMILKHEGPVLLFSSDQGLSARIWMILSQMGCKNIYILTNQADNEVLKYKFRPDTISKSQL